MNVQAANASLGSVDAGSHAAINRAEPTHNEAQTFERLYAREADKPRDTDAARDDAREPASTLDDERERSQWQTQVDAAVIAASVRPEPAAEARPIEPMSPAPLDELIARYVQQLAVSEPSTLADRRIMLKLDASLLPDTELFLARSSQGGMLQAVSRSPELVRLIAEHTTALERRFAQRGLGTLRVTTSLEAVSG